MSTRLQNRLTQRFNDYKATLNQASIIRCEGRLLRSIGLTLEVTGLDAAIGTRCQLIADGKKICEAEVVGFNDDRLFLMATGSARGLKAGTRVISTGQLAAVPVGQHLLGRVINAQGQPLDKGPALEQTNTTYPLYGKPMNPLARDPISVPLDVGVQAINSLMTVGQGQRLGLFAGSGVGKSVLLGMMTRFTQADVIVVGLIGERGREVKEFIEMNLGAEGLQRSVVIAVPADEAPLMRLQGALWATTVAEYFRDQGANVLLLMDSLTRFAQAQREIALAIGEPPATKGYPPSVFTRLPQLVERAGNAGAGQGSITAFYSILVEGDDPNDPIADAARAILDGHIVLSRELADAGHFPAIDVERSLSRVMNLITSPEQQQAMQTIKRWYSKYQQNRDLLAVGAYVAGSDPDLDLAIQMYPKIETFLRQAFTESANFESSLQHLFELVNSA